MRTTTITHGISKILILAGLFGWFTPTWADTAGSAAQLKTKYASLNKDLRNSPFNRPLIIDSKEESDSATGEVYAVVNYPFSIVNNALKDPAHW